jgi:hypothetical protein
MPALLDRPNQNVWSLWSYGNDKWHHMDTSNDEAAIRLKAESLTNAGSSPIDVFAWWEALLCPETSH